MRRPFGNLIAYASCLPVSTGRICHALGPTPPEPCPFVRVSFSSASDEDLTQGIARLGTVLRSFAQLKDVATAVGHPENA